MNNFGCALRDVIIAILRLVMLQLVLFVTGVHHILFNRTEVSNISLSLIPQRRDRERLAFMDDLKANNFDLIKNAALPPASCTDFKEDDIIDELGDFDDDDLDDFYELEDDIEDDENNDEPPQGDK